MFYIYFIIISIYYIIFVVYDQIHYVYSISYKGNFLYFGIYYFLRSIYYLELIQRYYRYLFICKLKMFIIKYKIIHLKK